MGSMKTLMTAFTAATILGTPSLGSAECVRVWKDIPEATRLAALVFSGTVVEITGDPDGAFVTFEVDRTWRGPTRRRLVLPLYMTLDSVHFAKGQGYVVFADRHVASRTIPGSMKVPTVSEPVFEVSICSPTKPLEQAQATVAQLGRGTKP
jgi:hypothetical protein